jgi:hypothetical protein
MSEMPANPQGPIRTGEASGSSVSLAFAPAFGLVAFNFVFALVFAGVNAGLYGRFDFLNVFYAAFLGSAAMLFCFLVSAAIMRAYSKGVCGRSAFLCAFSLFSAFGLALAAVFAFTYVKPATDEYFVGAITFLVGTFGIYLFQVYLAAMTLLKN